MVIDMILGTVGGLGLFLYGMTQMSGGLKKVAGQRLKSILRSMTQKRIIGFLVGAGVTALIQSSSATTVMIVGFVNASLLTLKQAIPVIIGTNVGTTATAWLVSISGLEAFKITAYALPAVGVGFGLQVFGRTRTVKDVGQILVGFGILFIGIDFMKVTFKPLEASQNVQQALIWFGSYPLLAVLAGTMLIVIPFILGDNIGTTITAQLAALRTNLNARRAAWAHTMFNVMGACIWFWFIGLLGKLVETVAPWEFGPTTIAASIAVAHTTIKLLDSAVFLPLSGVLEKVVVFINREKPSDVEARPAFLEEHLLNTPEIAIDQARREIVRMARFAKKAVNQAIEGLDENDRKKLELARQTEDAIDNFQYEITSYLAALSTRELSKELSIELPVLLHTVNDIERVGDHAVNIAEIAERKIEQKLVFSDSAQEEGARLKSETNEMFDRITAALENNDTEAARSALTNEENLNRMQVEFRRTHVQRMSEAVCSPEAGLIFIDLVDNIEKIGDHLTNIAQAVIGGLQWDGVEAKTRTDA
jgi:phosphate:Na+ symporter